MKLRRLPNGEYVGALSDMNPYLFELVISATNLLEHYDQSTISLMELLVDESQTSQEILSAVVNELSDLEDKNIVNVQFEHQPFESVGYIRTEPFDLIGEC